LIDTNYLHTIAWSRALADLGEWAPMNAIHRLVGMGGDQLVPELLGHDVEGRAMHGGPATTRSVARPGRSRVPTISSRACTTWE